MDNRSVPDFLKSGFTLIELLVSVFVLTVVATIVMVDLRASRRTEELTTAARVIAGDLRSLQSRALTGQNINTCTPAQSIVCELSTSACGGAACIALPPFGVGGHFVIATSTYTFFADVDPAKNDWRQTDPSEIFLQRDLAASGAPNVIIDALTLPAPTGTVSLVDVAFQRQNGSMMIGGCTGSCNSTLTIRLRHTISGAIKTIELRALSGQVSIP